MRLRRATWVRTRPDPAELVSWSIQHDFRDLFVGVGSDISADELSWLREVVEQAHESKIRVAALGGEEAWLDKPRKAKAWARTMVGTGLFDGIHVELEPWNREDWLTHRSELVRDYLDALKAISGASSLPVDADVAFWLHEVPARSGSALDVAVMRIVDAVTVLSFRNIATGPDGIIGVASRALATASRAGVPCRLAVETRDLGPDPRSSKQTFHGLGLETLDTVLTTVDHLEANNPTYNGVAIKTLIGGEAPIRRWGPAR
jgi:hypothetical protein